MLITGMLHIRESNSSAPFIRYAGIEVVPFQQHPYEPIIPISGGPRGDVRLRSSVVMRLVQARGGGTVGKGLLDGDELE